MNTAPQERDPAVRHEASQKPEKCPACGSNHVADILYGLPDFSDELCAELDAGKTVLGGCCLTGDDPEWRCVDCEMDVYKKGREDSR